jgi:hypothetical protein
MKISSIRPQFSEFIPDKLDDGVLYISERYKTASHNCACGCGEEVVTPLSPVDWQLSKEVNSVSLYPSIGNWNYACRSHYWIRKNVICWAGSMTAKEIAQVQAKDLRDKTRHIKQVNNHKYLADPSKNAEISQDSKGLFSWVSKVAGAVCKWLTRR